MRRDIIKARRGGLDYADLEARVLGGDMRALRPLVRQAGSNTLDMRFAEPPTLRAKPDGTGGARLEFEGCFSTTEAPYEMQDWAGPYTEIVRSGAFANTLGVPLGSWSTKPDTIFCLNHGWDAAPMGRTLAGTVHLMEDSQGGQTQAQLDGARADVYTVQSAMDAKELDAMSFAFWTIRQQWSPDYEQRDILEVDMDGGDVSVVTWPANPGTTGTTALRARAGKALLRSSVPRLLVTRAREEIRVGKALSAATESTLTEVLDLISESGDGMSTARELLSGLLGVEVSGDTSETDAAGMVDIEAQSGDPDTSPTPAMSLSLMRLLEDPAVRTAVPA